MENKVVIIGHIGAGKTALIDSIESKLNQKVTVVAPDEAKQLPFNNIDPILITNHYEGLLPPFIDNTKKFTCKGKHQYREVRNTVNEGEGGTLVSIDWVCECGRKL